MLIIAAIVALVNSELQQLLYPLALLSVAGTVMMLTIVNTMLVTIALRRSGTVERWRDALPLIVAGLALALIEIIVINVIRAALTAAMGLPF